MYVLEAERTGCNVGRGPKLLSKKKGNDNIIKIKY